MASTYVERLIKRVIELSESNLWEEAILEWNIIDCEEDESADSECVCGKENLRYLYTIKNINNGNELFPIGSSCIGKFERYDLDEITSINESMFKLYRTIRNNEFIYLTPEFFTRKLLYVLEKEGAFVDNKYNNYDSYDDYEFLLKMFNKRNKWEITENQERKIRGIIGFLIRPYLEHKLESKIRN